MPAGGTLVIACWCQREATLAKPFSQQEQQELQFLCEEWAHPYFISIKDFERLLQVGCFDLQRRKMLVVWCSGLWESPEEQPRNLVAHCYLQRGQLRENWCRHSTLVPK